MTAAADVLLWRNKKISSSVLAVATAAWVFFEWLDYHFLTIVSFVLVLGMVVQFGWSSFAGMLNGYILCNNAKTPTNSAFFFFVCCRHLNFGRQHNHQQAFIFSGLLLTCPVWSYRKSCLQTSAPLSAPR